MSGYSPKLSSAKAQNILVALLESLNVTRTDLQREKESAL